MKKVIRTVALFTVLGVAATSCQKDELVVSQASIAEVTVTYMAGNQYGSAVLADDVAWDLFLTRMLALAREGYEVTIFSGLSSGHNSKEVVTFTTDNEDEAKHWAKNMTEQGYNVTISFDDKTGIYTCTAMK